MSVTIAPANESLPSFLQQNRYSSVAVLVDENTKKHCYPLIKKLLPKHTLILIKSGEVNKNLKACEQIWQAITDANTDRHGLLINLGGGVIGDMGGFCAATYKRGIDFVQVPTTLLSQVDASVGGKLGVDFNGLKNHIGVFCEPQTVLIDAQFLNTLPHRELRSGFAEIIKHCLIADADKWEQIRKRDLERQNWTDLIAHSVEVKKEVVRQDPTEKGLRKILNFGHTLGHAIESFYLTHPKKHLLHGEAIAAGMICEAYLSYKKKMLDLASLEQIEEFVFSIYGRAEITPSEIDQILPLTLQDKKNRDGKVKFSLLQGLGKCAFDVDTNAKEMREALEYYRG